MLSLTFAAFLVSAVSAQLLFPFPPGPSGQSGPFQPQNPNQGRPAPPPNNVDMVIVGVTTGNRNPNVFLQNDPNRGQWGTEGQGMLNTIGKQEALALGRALKQRYGNVIPRQYFPTNFMSVSSTGESESMTAQTVNAGLFPPQGEQVFDPSINWQPVPITTDNTVCGMPRVDQCPTMRQALGPVFNQQTPEIQGVLQREQEVVNYVVQNAGVSENIQDLSEVAENLRQLYIRKMRFPQWAENPRLSGYSKQRLYQKIQVFRNAIEVACSVYQPCQKMASGVLINEIVQTIQGNMQTRTRTTETDNDRLQEQPAGSTQMAVYTGDVEVILSAFRVFNIGQFNVPTTGGFVIEVSSQGSQGYEPTIRILTFAPTQQNPQQIQFFRPQQVAGPRRQTQMDCINQPCRANQFIRAVQSQAIPDYRTACNAYGCNVVTPYARTGTENDVDVFPNPKTMTKGVDCTVATDKFPTAACQELARENYCQRNNLVRNVVCVRTCFCTRTI